MINCVPRGNAEEVNMNEIQVLDCTLRDGAYINGSKFGVPAIKGIIKKLQDARIDVIECGWLKDTIHEVGSSYYHVPMDLKQYLLEKDIVGII